ncbi:hypothetical protein ACQCVP_13785 [Rossellomorea vietnamensis]
MAVFPFLFQDLYGTEGPESEKLPNICYKYFSVFPYIETVFSYIAASGYLIDTKALRSV